MSATDGATWSSFPLHTLTNGIAAAGEPLPWNRGGLVNGAPPNVLLYYNTKKTRRIYS